MKQNEYIPCVSLIVPCRNEGQRMKQCIDHLLASDYPQEKLEILVVDGMSTDGTAELLREYAQHKPNVKLLINSKKITPCAFNLGIRAARGDYLIIISAHTLYATDYVSKCVDHLAKYPAAAVGGIRQTLPASSSIIPQTITFAINHPLTAGGATYRTGTDRPKWVDTAFSACYRREVFERIGLFDERLTRGQDREFNVRLTASGGKILLSPSIRCHYVARSKLRQHLAWSFQCGVWPFYGARIIGKRMYSWRNFAPMAFVLGISTLAFASLFAHPISFLLLLLLTCYFSVLFGAGLRLAIGKRRFLLALTVPLVFFATHVAYGLGSIYGWLKPTGTRSQPKSAQALGTPSNL